jgi:hypothetical protein
MRNNAIRPAVDHMEDRIALSTMTIVNHSTKAIFVQLYRHIPGSSGMLGDGTSIGPAEPGYSQWIGFYKINPGAARDFGSGDGNPEVRLAYQGSNSFIGLKGPDILRQTSRYSTSSSAYEFRRTDGSTNLNVTVGGHNYGLRSAGSLSSLGIKSTSGFYRTSSDLTISIKGPKSITGTQTFSFADYTSPTGEKSIQHVFYTPHGTNVTGYSVSLASNRGDNISFYKIGNTLVEAGSISGGGLFQYGGSYVGTVKVSYAYT